MHAYQVVVFFLEDPPCWSHLMCTNSKMIICITEASILKDVHVLHLLQLFFNGKPIEAQSAGLFLPCKWFPFTAPRYVKWGSMGLLLFFSASLSPHSSVMSMAKWQRQQERNRKQGGNNCYQDMYIFTLNWAATAPVGMDACLHEEGRAANIIYPTQQVKKKQQLLRECCRNTKFRLKYLSTHDPCCLCGQSWHHRLIKITEMIKGVIFVFILSILFVLSSLKRLFFFFGFANFLNFSL